MIALIYAESENGVIGHGNDLPWHLPRDLTRFKALTTGHPIIMGRKTHESIGRALPGRRNIVMSRGQPLSTPNVTTVGSFEAALAEVEADETVFVIGGAEIFRLALPHADRIYRTVVHGTAEGDIHAPTLHPEEWHRTSAETHPADDRNAYAVTFEELTRTG